ncbi:MAG: 3-deoxy-8-phosphooctulonate synthase [Deltaproteobacteria bacterium]|jgi:2-dehydro-3-deoxyphosphooctonate aldolase (KDO 8-P synthase)|nr:3-deoxy-8-phosphooctulonate synthase [Deltaproteobacteria bacterium]MCW8893308.1 3-deoxy-8-phosphooctulonate synthase [Deltaproteobacteria bacterium]MCW9049620.1 3-deoxy-8-phosphooctulonate synthase [Deltaproteobacteria bacterium]
MQTVHVGPVSFGGSKQLTLIAGPCAIEDESLTLRIAEGLKKITQELGCELIFKASYDKANRTSVTSFRGLGVERGLRVLERVNKEFELPIISDVHDVSQVEAAAQVLDILQIPAFLSRQTDLLVAAGKTGKPINLKKGQFLAPWDIEHGVKKIASTGNDQIVLTERGVTFGYNNLVTDMRSLVIMRNMGYPVVFDATHSVQLPGGAGGSSSGQREFVGALSRAAAATGIDGLFWEVHENPDQALCDGANSLPLSQVKSLLQQILEFDAIFKQTDGKKESQ